MEPTLQTKPAFRVIGFSNNRDCAPGVIPAVWATHGPTLDALPSLEPGVFYGVMYDFDPASRTFVYLAAIPSLEESTLPEGMVSYTVPEQTYAVFDATLSTIQDTFHQVQSQWLPTSGYTRGAGPELERYDERFDTEPSRPLTIWIPVDKSADS